MELQFTVSTEWTDYAVGIWVPDNAFEGGLLPIRKALRNLPSMIGGIAAPDFLQYPLPVGVVTCTPPLTGDLSLLFYEDAICLRAEFKDGEVRDSTNWYGYDGEMGDDGADNDEDAEDSDEDDDTVGDKV